MMIRLFETRLLELFSRGFIDGTVHTCIGQEACATGVLNAADLEKDLVFSNHRCHGHFLVYTGDVEGLLGEIMGAPSGVCGGWGGSQHLHSRNFFSNGIQGGMTPVAVGAALAEKRNASEAVTIVFLGDGTFGQGVLYESFNLSALWRLPILYVLEDNQYAQSTPSRMQHAGCLGKRGEPFGIPAMEVDASDVCSVFEQAQEAFDRVRHQESPLLLHLRTYRLGPHSKGDDTRDPAEIEQYRKRDPLLTLQRRLDASWCEAEEHRLRKRIDDSVSHLCESKRAGTSLD